MTEFQNWFQDLKYFKSFLDFFFLNSLEINIIQGEYSIPNIIMTQIAAGELELIGIQEDRTLQLNCKWTSITEFWKFVPELKHPELKKVSLSNYFNIRTLFHFKIREIQTPTTIN